jgi:hypothetical protein
MSATRAADSDQFRGRSLTTGVPLCLLACVLRAVHVAMSQHVASVGAGGSGGAHFQLRTTKIVDRNKPGIEDSRRPFPQSAPIAGAMRRATKALLFAPINAQAEWATAPDTRRLTFRSHRSAPRSTPRRSYVLVGTMSASRASAPPRDDLTRSARSRRASGRSNAPFPGLVETGGSPRISRT